MAESFIILNLQTLEYNLYYSAEASIPEYIHISHENLKTGVTVNPFPDTTETFFCFGKVVEAPQNFISLIQI